MFKFARILSLGFFALALVGFALSSSAMAADRQKVEAFLETTGFDVALDSIRLSASTAPEMLGLERDAFGSEWTRLADSVFDSELMRNRALDILEATLDDDLLDHATEYYASDLGQRLVEAENLAHFDDDIVVQEAGSQIVGALRSVDSPRLDYFKRMTHAIDPKDIGVRAIQEIQIRFLLAAAYADVIALKVDEGQLRAMMREDEDELREAMEVSGVANAAYTYQAFSDSEVLAYTEALEDPRMMQVYELMNAVHFEVMSNRFEALASRMGQMRPAQEL